MKVTAKKTTPTLTQRNFGSLIKDIEIVWWRRW